MTDRKKTLLKFLIVAAVLLFLALVTDFFFFLKQVPDSSLPDIFPNSRPQALVVLTGGKERLAKAFELSEQEDALPLFISGARKNVPFLNVIPDYLSDRVSLGFAACNTEENALEIARWMNQEKITSIRLITSAYHMPRAMFEMKKALPEDAVVFQHPVFSNNFPPDGRWKKASAVLLLLTEYFKYLGVRIKFVLGLHAIALNELPCERI